MPRGKTPSLIGGTNGKPKIVTAGKKCECSRCKKVIVKDEQCADIPKLTTSFGSTKRFCKQCLLEILDQSTQDLEVLRSLVTTD